jgi:transcription initiation factor TFIIB
MKLKMPIDDPMKFVPKIASKLNLEGEVEIQAIDILRKAKKLNGLQGKDPRGLAAAALYKASKAHNERRIQKDVAKAAGTSEVTLRNRLIGLEDLFQDSSTVTPMD